LKKKPVCGDLWLLLVLDIVEEKIFLTSQVGKALVAWLFEGSAFSRKLA
jgi:hypothetical protein